MNNWMVFCIIMTVYAVVMTIIFLKQRFELKRVGDGVRNPKSDGKIIIDHSDPDGPYIFLQLDAGVSELSSRSVVYLYVDNGGITRE